MKKTTDGEASLPVLKTIGEHLRELRIAKGFDSQEQFATHHGLARVQYWRLERGVANLTFKTLAKILAIHGLTIEEFFEIILKKKAAVRNNKSFSVDGKGSNTASPSQ